MISDHQCDSWKMWTADPRVPINRSLQNEHYVIQVNDHNNVIICFCPFCGEKLAANEQLIKAKCPCTHLEQLSLESESSVGYNNQQGEYWLFGGESLVIRFFYCPICGCKLPLHDNASSFHTEDPKERDALTIKLEGILTIDQIVRQFGPPDIDRGYTLNHFYPDGKRVDVGYNRAIFYEHLAQTIIMVAVETLNGRLEVNFIPKEK
jgi:hypothetical protein